MSSNDQLGGTHDAAELYARRVLELTRQMLKCAEQEDWDAVMERDALRVRQMQNMPATFPGSEDEQAAGNLRRALALEDQVRKLMEAERERLGQASRNDKQMREASDAYRRAARD